MPDEALGVAVVGILQHLGRDGMKFGCVSEMDGFGSTGADARTTVFE